MPIDRADHRGADDQPPMARHFHHARQQLPIGEVLVLHRHRRNRAALGAERDHLRHREKREHRGHQADAIPQEQHVAGIARRAGLRVHADGGQHQAVEADDQALDDLVAAGEEGNEADAEQRDQEELGRAELQHDRLEDRDHDGEDDRRR